MADLKVALQELKEESESGGLAGAMPVSGTRGPVGAKVVGGGD
jgi:hypothetical protein